MQIFACALFRRAQQIRSSSTLALFSTLLLLLLPPPTLLGLGLGFGRGRAASRCGGISSGGISRGCGVGGGPRPALRLRGGRGAGAIATPAFDASLVELLEYLRSTSNNNVSATAACTPAGHVGGGHRRGGEGRENGALASFVESELEEEEPNYNRYIPVCIYLFSPL